MAATPKKSKKSGEKLPDITEPAGPGLSAKINGGTPFVKYLIAFTIAGMALFAAYSGLIGILLPNQIQGLAFNQYFDGTSITNINDLAAVADMANSKATLTADQQTVVDLYNRYNADRARNLSNILAISSFFTLFAQPIVGVISDRWKSKTGRRAFWIVAGAVAGALFMIGLRYSTTLALIAIFWVAVQVSLNFMQAPLTATIADRIPEKRLGTVSGLTGVGTMIGGLAGSLVAGLLFGIIGLNAYFVFGILVAIAAILFVLMAPDRSSEELELEPFSWKEFFKGFITPLKDHDFRWVWLARFAFMFGYQAINTYTLFILQSYIKPAMTADQANIWFPIISIIGMPFMLLSMMVSGTWSDKVGKRKPFVAMSSFGVAIALLIPFLWPSLPAVIIYTILANLFIGIYFAVDQALFIDVLPDKKAAGRDLGVANVATNIGQALAPVVGGQLVAMTIMWGNGYKSIYLMAAVLVAIGGFAIYRVRKVN